MLFPGLSDTYPFSSTRAFALWPSSLYGGTEYREKGLRLEVGQRMDVAGLLESPDFWLEFCTVPGSCILCTSA